MQIDHSQRIASSAQDNPPYLSTAMIHTADWCITLVFFCGLLGLAVSSILVFAHKAETFPARLLAGFLASVLSR